MKFLGFYWATVNNEVVTSDYYMIEEEDSADAYFVIHKELRKFLEKNGLKLDYSQCGYTVSKATEELMEEVGSWINI